MVAPIIAAAAKAGAGKAVKNAAKSAAKKAARGVKKGDFAVNARKRYARAADRYLKEAGRTEGAVSARNREVAKRFLDDALSTYDYSRKTTFSKQIRNLASEFGVDLESVAEKRKGQKPSIFDNVISRSEFATVRGMGDVENRRQLEADAIFRSEPIAQRIYGGTVEIWRDDATVVNPDGSVTVDNSKILPSLYEHFGVDNLADLLEKIVDMTGDSIYKELKSNEWYEFVKTLIQSKIPGNELVA